MPYRIPFANTKLHSAWWRQVLMIDGGAEFRNAKISSPEIRILPLNSGIGRLDGA